MELINLFSVPLFQKNLSIDNEKILSYCKLLEKNDSGRTVSNLGGWQSNDIQDYPIELSDLLHSIQEFSYEICNILEIGQVNIYNCWANINRYKDCNWPHTHDDAILSGVYYVKTPQNCGDIEFESPINVSPFLRTYCKNNFNSSNWWMPSEEGVLYIFPSWLRHGVNQNLNETEERVSISFNLVH